MFRKEIFPQQGDRKENIHIETDVLFYWQFAVTKDKCCFCKRTIRANHDSKIYLKTKMVDYTCHLDCLPEDVRKEFEMDCAINILEK